MSGQPWALVALIGFIVLLALIGIGTLIRSVYKGTPSETRQGVPIGTLLGVSILGVVAMICVSGIAYGLSVGQTGSIQTIQKSGTPTPNQAEQTTPDQAKQAAPAQAEQTVPMQGGEQAAQINAGTVGVVSNAQGLGILATIASAAVGGIAGVLVQRSPQ